MPKLIDAEAAKAALRILARSEASYGTIERAMKALDALPDASPKAIHAERIPVPPHLAEAQRVVIKQAQQAGDGAEEETC
jgi:hypothetical protein